jgi:DNA-binding MarR family transcriptional regulator
MAPTRRRSSRRNELLDRLQIAGRELSVAAVMFHTALAAKQGLSASEEKALDLLERFGPLTGRELSNHSGLAPNSVTGLIDRLESKGFVRRVPNPNDRRSVLITPVEDRLAGLQPLFADWVESINALCDKYTDQELATIIDFLTEAASRQRDAARRL